MDDFIDRKVTAEKISLASTIYLRKKLYLVKIVIKDSYFSDDALKYVGSRK